MDFSPEDEAALDALGEEISRAQTSPFLARSVVAAFRPREWIVQRLRLRALTFGAWLELEEARSPFLVDDWAGMREPTHVAAALRALSGVPVTVGWLVRNVAPECAAEFLGGIRAVIHEAFSTAIRMRAPGVAATDAAATEHGFGTWLALLTLMATLLHRRPDELMDMRVSQAFALAATSDYLAGKAPVGANYAEREIFGSGEEVDLVGGVPNVERQGERGAEHVEQQHAEGQAEAQGDVADATRTDDAQQTRDDG